MEKICMFCAFMFIMYMKARFHIFSFSASFYPNYIIMVKVYNPMNMQFATAKTHDLLLHSYKDKGRCFSLSN